MKKVYLTLFMAASIFGIASAQQSVGGFPASMSLIKVQNQEVAEMQLSRPDYEGIIEKNNADEAAGVLSPYKVATLISSDISLANSGTWSYLEDGRKIWRLSITVPDAKAVGLLYDHFNLPKGVKFFIRNENAQQLLGAYTAVNNNKTFGNFVTEPVQGQTAYLEIDIPAKVSVDDIVFHINKVAAYYRGMNAITNAFGGIAESTAARPTGVGAMGAAAACNVDANCDVFPNFITKDYTIPKRSSVHILIYQNSSAGFCSGTLVNNTGNSEGGTCKPYVLTASHCDGSNSYTDANFSQWQFWFNFRKTQCNGGNDTSDLEDYTILNGAHFRARSFYPSLGSPGAQNPRLVGDFLLLELENTPNASVNTYLSGWNRSMSVVGPGDHFFVGYHYPHGDVEKQSFALLVQANGQFNQNQVPGTHWHVSYSTGGTQPGSSGSGLFDKDGLLMGDLSGGVSGSCNLDPNVTDFSQDALYCKISYAWENDYDQANHSAHAGSESRLKDWLDPTGSDAMKLASLKPDCSPANSINKMGLDLDNNIEVYPTPSTTGLVYARMNLKTPTNLKVAIYNPLGRLVKSFVINKAFQGDYSFDCSGLANGIYVMKFSGAGGSMSAKKIMITK